MNGEPSTWEYRIDPPDGDDEREVDLPMLEPEEELPELDLADEALFPTEA